MNIVIVNGLYHSDLVQVLQSPFQFASPVLMHMDSNNSFSSNVKMGKMLGKAINFSSFKIAGPQALNKLHLNTGQNIVFHVKSLTQKISVLDAIDKQNLGVKNSLLVIFESSLLLSFNDINIRIDQEVFFLERTSMTLYEAYKINGYIVSSLIGHYTSVGDAGLEFIFENRGWKRFLGSRRNNFYGQHIIGIAAHDPPYVYLRHGYKRNATFFETNQTYHVSDWIDGGMYYQIFLELSRDLNFTFDLYKRLDDVWGTVVDENTTTGIVNSIADGNGDIGVTDFAIMNNRLQRIAYLPVINDYIPSIFIRSFQPEAFTWALLIYPLSGLLWLVIIVTSLIISTWFFIFNHQPGLDFLVIQFGFYFVSDTTPFIVAFRTT